MSSLVRIKPNQYIHVQDNNTSIQRVLVGPQTFTKQDHEEIIRNPTNMCVIPPRYYMKIKNPYIRKDDGSKDPVTDDYGQAKVRHDDSEIRFYEDWSEPFFLYPGEIQERIQKLEIVPVNHALRIKAERDFTDEDGNKRVAGDEWWVKGPGTYRPRVEESVKSHEQASIITEGTGLKVKARQSFVDANDIKRQAGESWIITETGAYFPHIFEDVIEKVQPINLSPERALYLVATDSFKDAYGKDRKAGDEWLVTFDDAETHMLSVFERKKEEVMLTTLSIQEYCFIIDPVGRDGRNQFGTRELRKGETSFFLQPGESMENNQILSAKILGTDEALLVNAVEPFEEKVEGKTVQRKAGEYWMINGPCHWVPRAEVKIDSAVSAIPLDENEGIYVRDWETGIIRAQKGPTSYMVQAHESLWSKDLPAETEKLLQETKFSDDRSRADVRNLKPRDKTRVVTYRVPHNCVTQLYDFKTRKARVVAGPALVMLEPDEQFTTLSLSGKTPKRPNICKTIAVRLGPDFMADVIEVETSDHARLRLTMAYNWYFNINDGDYSRIFTVRDFVGDCCKAIAGRVRGVAATKPFDVFHRKSAEIIKKAVFGETKDGKVCETFQFEANNLCITNIDVQHVEPVDHSTRESLMKSVQLAIKITADNQERSAKHIAQRTEQEARGHIEKQKIQNSKNSESKRKEFIELQGVCKAIEQSGSAKAEAQARALSGEIKGNNEIETAKLNVKASNIEANSELEDTKATQKNEIEHKAELAKIKLGKAKALSEIEASKFKRLVAAIGPSTIQAIAQSGPEIQARLLKGLGLKGYLMTDGNSPINLFNAAKGMVGQ